MSAPTSVSRRRPGRWLGALLLLTLATCRKDPVAVRIGLEILVVSGDDQYGTAGQTLGTALRAQVRSEATGRPQEDVGVRWSVTEGAAGLVDERSTTDSTGSTEAHLRLGATTGQVQVRVAVASQPSASVTFTAHTVEAPALIQVSPTAAKTGDTITLTGANFSPVASQDVVLFSGVRGRVLAASQSMLAVEVPRCLPARNVDVRVQLGAVPSGSLPLTITGGGEVTPLVVGQVVDVADDAGLTCLTLEGATGRSYLALVYSARSVGSGTHPYELTALGSTASPMPLRVAPLEPALPRGTEDPQAGWDAHLHDVEGELLRGRRLGAGGPRGAAAVSQRALPAVGEARTFHVLNSGGTYEDVTAVAAHVGESVVIFVDGTAPAEGFQPSDLATLGDRFDEVIYPLVSTTFGPASDLDGNGRVAVLFTPRVNALTPRGSSGLIGGFFNGNDLLPSNTGSNGAEILYLLVPDPSGAFSDPVSRTMALSAVPAVVAHELQHMVHFNVRYLQLDLGQEALWLNEGLAQTSEELVARRYEELGDPDSAELFRHGARARTRLYLGRPDTVSAVFAGGRGTVAEYGAAFLHVLYLEDQLGVGVAAGLMRSTRTGVANVEAEAGRDWPGLIGDWWGATYLDGSGVGDGWLRYPNLDLAEYLRTPPPLEPAQLGPGDALVAGSLPSTAVRYFLLGPDVAGSLTVRLGGEGGGPIDPQALLRLRVVRLS